VTVHTGWYLLAFADEIGTQPTPFAIGDRQLIAFRTADREGGAGVRVLDAICPHRGAHLGYGGTVARNAVICPFHGKRIALGDPSCHWNVAEHTVLYADPCVFVRLADTAGEDRGFERAMKAITADRRLVAGFNRTIAVPADYVVENAFDPDHFTAVHGISKVSRQRLDIGPDGELEIELGFHIRPPGWLAKEGPDDAVNGFHARAYSPNVVVSEVSAPGNTQIVITTSTPTPTGSGTRITYAITPEQEPVLQRLIAGGHRAMSEDIPVWEHLDLTMTPRYDGRDAPVRAFRQFCASFPELGPA
jgi:3-ketosteroid 9alpha-monooxygenase subunit A